MIPDRISKMTLSCKWPYLNSHFLTFITEQNYVNSTLLTNIHCRISTFLRTRSVHNNQSKGAYG